MFQPARGTFSGQFCAAHSVIKIATDGLFENFGTADDKLVGRKHF